MVATCAAPDRLCSLCGVAADEAAVSDAARRCCLADGCSLLQGGCAGCAGRRMGRFAPCHPAWVLLRASAAQMPLTNCLQKGLRMLELNSITWVHDRTILHHRPDGLLHG